MEETEISQRAIGLMSICLKVDIKAIQLPNFLEQQQMQSFSYNNMLNVIESTQTHRGVSSVPFFF